jgi:hypothetical protein
LIILLSEEVVQRALLMVAAVVLEVINQAHRYL